MAIKKTYRGQSIDMEALVRQNKDTVAAGNMKANANGDILGNGGVIIRKAGEVSRQHYNNTQNTVTENVSLKDPVKDDSKKQVTAKRSNVVTPKKEVTEVEQDNGDIVMEETKDNRESK